MTAVPFPKYGSGRYLPWTIAWSFEYYHAIKDAIKIDLADKHPRKSLRSINSFYQWFSKPGPELVLHHNRYYLPSVLFTPQKILVKAVYYHLHRDFSQLYAFIQTQVKTAHEIREHFQKPRLRNEARFLEGLKVLLKEDLEKLDQRVKKLDDRNKRGHKDLQEQKMRNRTACTYIVSAAAIMKTVRLYLGEDPLDLEHPSGEVYKQDLPYEIEVERLKSREAMFREQEAFEVSHGTGLQGNLRIDQNIRGRLFRRLDDDFKEVDLEGNRMTNALLDHWGYYESQNP